MTFNRALWGEVLKPYQPHYPCPNCRRGRLEHAEISDCTIAGLRSDPPGRELFVKGLECELCGQLVVVHGYEKGRRQIPKGMYPAPPIITIPSKTPPVVRRELERAFALFWVDLGACANKLRISLERVLDHFQIKSGPLASRIAHFSRVDPVQAATFDALKQVGNVGSHEGANTRGTILDSFEYYEHALDGLFGEKRQYFERLRARIITKKGR